MLLHVGIISTTLRSGPSPRLAGWLPSWPTTGFSGVEADTHDGSMLVEHMEHVIDVAGEESVALGTDYDGLITPPRI